MSGKLVELLKRAEVLQGQVEACLTRSARKLAQSRDLLSHDRDRYDLAALEAIWAADMRALPPEPEMAGPPKRPA